MLEHHLNQMLFVIDDEPLGLVSRHPMVQIVRKYFPLVRMTYAYFIYSVYLIIENNSLWVHKNVTVGVCEHKHPTELNKVTKMFD
jgi:hypothetical protein